jgi:hypothetical protein
VTVAPPSLSGALALQLAAAAEPALDPAQVNGARDLVLAAPEFNVSPDWQSQFIDWLVKTLENAGAWLPAGLRVYFLLALLVGLVVFALWLLRDTSPGAGRAGRGARAEAEGATPSSFDAQREAARTALAEGRFADCVRAVWAGALVLLDRAGISRAADARADWEHIEAARRRRADLVEPLSTIVTVFQRSHFGAVPVVPGEAEACIAVLAQLETALGRHG